MESFGIHWPNSQFSTSYAFCLTLAIEFIPFHCLSPYSIYICFSPSFFFSYSSCHFSIFISCPPLHSSIHLTESLSPFLALQNSPPFYVICLQFTSFPLSFFLPFNSWTLSIVYLFLQCPSLSLSTFLAFHSWNLSIAYLFVAFSFLPLLLFNPFYCLPLSLFLSVYNLVLSSTYFFLLSSPSAVHFIHLFISFTVLPLHSSLLTTVYHHLFSFPSTVQLLPQ